MTEFLIFQFLIIDSSKTIQFFFVIYHISKLCGDEQDEYAAYLTSIVSAKNPRLFVTCS